MFNSDEVLNKFSINIINRSLIVHLGNTKVFLKGIAIYHCNVRKPSCSKQKSDNPYFRSLNEP